MGIGDGGWGLGWLNSSWGACRVMPKGPNSVRLTPQPELMNAGVPHSGPGGARRPKHSAILAKHRHPPRPEFDEHNKRVAESEGVKAAPWDWGCLPTGQISITQLQGGGAHTSERVKSKTTTPFQTSAIAKEDRVLWTNRIMNRVMNSRSWSHERGEAGCKSANKFA